MFNKVVIGIDGFRTDLEAIAAARAVAPGATYDLVTVYPDGDQQPHVGFDQYRERLRGDAVRLLEAQREAAGLPDAEIHAIPGYAPSRSLKQYARDAGADLIVLGSENRGAIDRAIVGDVARGVLHGAPCPVLSVARSHALSGSRPATIGVAYDGSPESEHALEAAVEVARALGGRIELVQAVDVAVNPLIWGPTLAEYCAGLVAPQNEAMQARAAGLPVDATGSAIQGPTRQVVHELSTRVDLMVCGSRSWGTAGRIAFGSTADHLVHHSPCPVLVIPRTATAEGKETDDGAAPVSAGDAA